MNDRCVICGGKVHETLLTCAAPACRAKLNTKPEREIAALRHDRVLTAFRKLPPGGKAYIHMLGRDGSQSSGWIEG